MRNFHKNLMLEGGWRAGRPPDLLAREKKTGLILIRTRPCGPYLSGFARQLLNRRSGSARLRSTASQSLLAALRSAKQSSHMRSRRSPRLT